MKGGGKFNKVLKNIEKYDLLEQLKNKLFNEIICCTLYIGIPVVFGIPCTSVHPLYLVYLVHRYTRCIWYS